MANIFANVRIQYWPDYLLVVSGTLLLASTTAMFSGIEYSGLVSLLLGGVFVFGIGAQIAHFRYRDKSVNGNANAWFSGWRHSFLADAFSLIGVAIVGVAAYFIYVRIWP